MITFQIDHPDFNSEPSTISLYFEKFLVGSSNRCHLRFPDEQNAIYLKATQLENKFIIESINDHFFVLNGKKYRGTLKCEKGDIITLGMAKITIVDMDLSQVYKEIDFPKEHKKFITSRRELRQVMSALESELIFSENEPS